MTVPVEAYTAYTAYTVPASPFMQISWGGRATSLNDHATAENAARALGRVAISYISKGGTWGGGSATRKLLAEQYTDELEILQGEDSQGAPHQQFTLP